MRRPPPPPRPDFSKPQERATTSGSLADGIAGISVNGSAMMGRNPKLPPFLPTSAPANAKRPNRAEGMWEIRNVALPSPATTIQPPFSPLPINTVMERTMHRPPTAVMQLQEEVAESRRMIHTAPELRQSKALLQDLAERLPKHLEGKKWYSELHKLKNKYDPRWHSSPTSQKDLQMKGAWTSVPIHGTEHDSAGDEDFGPKVPPKPNRPDSSRRNMNRPSSGSTRSDRSTHRDTKHRSNWNADGLAQVLQERAKHAAPNLEPNNDVDPYVRALLVLEKPPKMRVGGYTAPQGRFERRYITAQYMREFYTDLDKSTKMKKIRSNKARQGKEDVEEDVFARLEGDELTRTWAQARMDKLYEQAEMKWDDANGHLVAERRARLREQQEQQWISKGLVAGSLLMHRSSEHRESGGLQKQPSAKDLFGQEIVAPEEVHALRQSMYRSIQDGVKDLSAPEYVYYEDPSYGAFDVLIAPDDQPASMGDKYCDPVAQETVESRLRRVTLRNRGQALVKSEQGKEVAGFLKTATGLPADNARQILVDRIGQRMSEQADAELSPTAATSGNALSMMKGPHVEHLVDKPRDRSYGITEARDDFDAIFG